MKMNKMIGAVALTAALAMGSVPAFATAGVDKSVQDRDWSTTSPTSAAASWSGVFDDSGNKTQGYRAGGAEGGSTEVHGKVESTMSETIRASVPLKVVIVFGAEKYSDIQAPNKSDYGITNLGTNDLYVKEVNFTKGALQGGIKFEGLNEATAGSGEWFSSVSNASSKITTDNILMLTWEATDLSATPVTVKNYLGDGHGSKQFAGGMGADKNWFSGATNMSSLKVTPGNTMGIKLGGRAYMGTKVEKTQLTDTLCTLTYTVSPTA